MSKHTKGPWHFEPFGILGTGKINAYENAHRAIAKLPDAKSTAEHEENVANARLIAAAPELLAALRSLVKRYEQATSDVAGEARAAIAKATGAE